MTIVVVKTVCRKHAEAERIFARNFESCSSTSGKIWLVPRLGRCPDIALRMSSASQEHKAQYENQDDHRFLPAHVLWRGNPERDENKRKPLAIALNVTDYNSKRTDFLWSHTNVNLNLQR